MRLLDGLFRSSPVEALFTDSAYVQYMLNFESALARASANAGLIPASSAEAIARSCHAGEFDLATLQSAVPASGNLAIPLVKQLTVLVARENSVAAGHVHWGATSQDVQDTALILQLRDAIPLFLNDLHRLADSLTDLTAKHRETPVIARTWLQHAVPTTFGFIAAGWLDAVLRHINRFSALPAHTIALQFGGAAGNLASLGEKSSDVTKYLAKELNLSSAIPWHSNRDRLAEFATACALLSATLHKIASDLVLYMQTEVAEISESAAGGSSSMPNKQNPVVSAAVVACASRVPGLLSTFLSAISAEQHQRGIGSWHAEWETLPQLVSLSASALHHSANLIPQLQIHAEKMRENIELTHGLVFSEAVSMALAPKLGKQAAHDRVAAAAMLAQSQSCHLREILASDLELSPLLSPTLLDSLFDPSSNLGAALAFTDQILSASRSRSVVKSTAKG